MNVRRALVVLVLSFGSLGSLGCQQDPYLNSYLESLRAEKLWLEDQYYALESDFDVNAEHLASAREENNALRTRLGLRVEPIDDRPRLAHPSPGERGLDLDAPAIELGSPLDPDAPDRASLPVGNGVAKPVAYESPHYESLPEIFETPAASPEPIDRRVTHIVLNSSHTSGYDFDGKIGDDGLAILIEPRNADNQFISEPGYVSLVVLDPALRDTSPHVARWDIDIAEAEQRMRRNALRGPGIYLRLPWPDGRPKHSKLQLFVRYVAGTGEKLQADTELHITLPGQLSQRWTPKSLRLNETGSRIALSQFVTDESGVGSRPQLREQQAVSVSPAAPSRPSWSPYR